jgi:hypothetical protein
MDGTFGLGQHSPWPGFLSRDQNRRIRNHQRQVDAAIRGEHPAEKSII